MSESTRFVIGLLLFAAAGMVLGFGALLVGHLVRPKKPGGFKNEIYECGEPTIGPAWVQFDLRFYVVALLFVIFDVEIAMLYPWAVVYKEYIENGFGQIAFFEMLFFFGLIVMGFLYLWKFGYLDWVRSQNTNYTTTTELYEQKKVTVPTSRVIAKRGSFASLRINSAKQSGLLDRAGQIASSGTPRNDERGERVQNEKV